MFDREAIRPKVEHQHWHHVKSILDSLISYGEGKFTRDQLGSFVGALVDGNLFEVCARADMVNQKYIYVYVYFMYNEMPSDKVNLKFKVR